MNFDYRNGRHSQDRANYQFRLPLPHSSIPIGLNVDSDRGEQAAQRLKRTDLTPSRSDQTLTRESREQLPSVRQLLSERNTGYMPPPQTSHFQDHALQSSPHIHSRLDSHFTPSRNNEGAHSNYSSVARSRSDDYETYNTPQSARLPSISQVGIEPLQARASKSFHSRSDFNPDSSGVQSHSNDFTISPTQTVPASSHLRSTPNKESLQAGPQVPVMPNQVVDERLIPGKGVCYIFADNSYCPKLIDGQPVNPNWGLTKAGKARKRLAQACIACREKKVKCQPNLPKCDQCQKSGRDCIFESTWVIGRIQCLHIFIKEFWCWKIGKVLTCRFNLRPRADRGRSSSYDPQSA